METSEYFAQRAQITAKYSRPIKIASSFATIGLIGTLLFGETQLASQAKAVDAYLETVAIASPTADTLATVRGYEITVASAKLPKGLIARMQYNIVQTERDLEERVKSEKIKAHQDEVDKITTKSMNYKFPFGVSFATMVVSLGAVFYSERKKAKAMNRLDGEFFFS